MKKIFFTPGPSQLYNNFKKYIDLAIKKDIPSISHRSKTFEKIFHDSVSYLKKLFNLPLDYQVFFLNSSLEAMEQVIKNAVEKTTLHFINGAFSKKWYQMAINLKKNPLYLEIPDGQGFELEIIEENLKKFYRLPIELICLTHNETSTGVILENKLIYWLRNQFPKSLIALDIVSSAPCIDIDWKMIDYCFFSVQKGFGLPAGLAVVFLSNNLIKKVEEIDKKKLLIRSYHDFLTLSEYSKKNQTPETPNVFFIYLLGKIAQLMAKKRLKKIINETKIKADLIYDFFDKNSFFKPFVQEKKFRSLTTINIVVDNSLKLKTFLEKKGLVVGFGYGKYKDNQIRIANFPSHSKKQVIKLIKAIELYTKI